MTVEELIDCLDKVEDKSIVVVYAGLDGGWTNIGVVQSDINVTIVPSWNREK